MTDREMLERLMKFFWYSSSEREPGLEWGYIEGTTLGSLDKELNDALVPIHNKIHNEDNPILPDVEIDMKPGRYNL